MGAAPASGRSQSIIFAPIIGYSVLDPAAGRWARFCFCVRFVFVRSGLLCEASAIGRSTYVLFVQIIGYLL